MNKGLYVHIPFCMKKCKYCDFNSFCGSDADKNMYLDALFDEMSGYDGEVCDTVFIGGGTPTALSAEEMGLLLKKIDDTFAITADVEFTMEANPKTIDAEKLSVMRENGVNRLSLGVQSFHDNELLALGRIHNAADAHEGFHLARDAGFDNINLDLMLAIPQQTKASLAENIRIAADLSPEHISCYSLILEEGTPLYDEYMRGELALPDDDAQADMYFYAADELKKYGYNRYEISNFALPGRESRHNKKYWQCREYIGVGLSAHSYVGGARYANTDNFSSYIKGRFSDGEKNVLTLSDKMSEFMFMGLRMTEGIAVSEFSERFGKNIRDVFEKPLLKFIKTGMLIEKNGRIFLADKAVEVSNQVMCEFIL